ncbi:hypothetical protein [Bradyrhizobium sp. G127]|uniref:hypothetical protein n=1 Tax=Bradyrhizobium sp. G127 TaxID=2904800 RepID=UPI001F409586|nr:hypothetical protein [Bradyrhizobium sp. G127]MCF2523218.1 hypothetical protein [Bradyrhizobium sp. G127]
MARPLIRKTEKGEPYTRPPGIESKIDEALGQDLGTLLKRARVTDNRSKDYLPPECLVHLIRDAISRGDRRAASALVPPLIIRCEANLLKTVPDGRMRNAEAIREEILSNLGLMFAEDGMEGHETELDYYECKFGRAFRSFRINHVRAEISHREELIDLPDSIGDDGEPAFDDEMLGRLSSMARINGAQEDSTYLPQVLRAVNDLPLDQKRAVVLCRIIGYDEESTDPNKRTAATICKVEGRTIRYRLKRADKRLKTFKEDL